MTNDRLRILLVDDDEVDRLTVRRALERAQTPFELTETKNLAAGDAALRACRFDCALVDYHLPDGAGLQILETARAARVPVIMLTGLDDEAFGVRAVRQGAQDYLVKNDTNSRILLRSIRHAVERSRRSGQDPMSGGVPSFHTLFGSLAVELGYLTEPELLECLDIQRTSELSAKFLGELCIDQGRLDQAAVRAILREQRKRLVLGGSGGRHRLADRLFGQLALRLGAVDRDALTRALREQTRLEEQGKPQRLGEVMVALGLMTAPQVIEVVAGRSSELVVCPLCLSAHDRAQVAGTTPRCSVCGEQLVAEISDLRPELFGQLPRSSDGGASSAVGAWSDRLIGTLWGGFAIERRIGTGSMGAVFLAHNTRLDRVVALKIPMGSTLEDSRARALFVREARAAAALDHPCIVRIYSVGEVEDRPYLEMEYVRGPTLEERLRDGPLTLTETVRVFLGICRGVAHAHDKGVVHRDLKPANVICAEDSRVLVMDFGLARRVEVQDSLHPADSIVGTAGYIAPELLDGKTAQPRSDIYSLGALLFRTLAGRMAYTGSTVLEVLTKQALQAPPPLTSVAPHVPSWLEQLTTKMMAKDPVQRPTSLHGVIEELLAQIEQRIAGGD